MFALRLGRFAGVCRDPDRRLWRLERQLRQRYPSSPARRHQHDAGRRAVGWRILGARRIGA